MSLLMMSLMLAVPSEGPFEMPFWGWCLVLAVGGVAFLVYIAKSGKGK